MTLSVVFCIPGREFSGRFLDCWTEFLGACNAAGVQYAVAREYDPVVYYARNKVLGGNTRSGPKQAPWGGAIPYDYMLWIDSDVIFRFQDFVALLERQVDVVSGLYLMADGKRFAAVEKMDEEHFKAGGAFEFLTPEAIAGKDALMPVDYSGFGFTLVRRGVFEKLEYPWFRPVFMEIDGCREFTSEDVGFALEAKRAGVQVYVDPRVIVGHEKSVVLRPPPAVVKRQAA